MAIRIDGLTGEVDTIGPYTSETTMLLEMIFCEIHNVDVTLKEILKKGDALDGN